MSRWAGRLVSGAAVAFTATAAPWRAVELGHSANSGWMDPAVQVIGTAPALRAAWLRLYPVPALRPALPAVNLSQWRVIVVAGGVEPTGGYQLRLDSARVVHDSALVDVTMYTPAAGCGVIEQLTHPAVAIATPVQPQAFRITQHQRADTARCH